MRLNDYMQPKKGKVIPMIVFILLAVAIIAGVAGQTMLKKGANEATANLGPFNAALDHALNLFLNPLVIVGVLCYGISAFAYIIALTQTDVSVALPITSLTYVLVAISAFALLGETVTLLRWAGIALVVLGSVLVGFSAA